MTIPIDYWYTLSNLSWTNGAYMYEYVSAKDLVLSATSIGDLCCF